LCLGNLWRKRRRIVALAFQTRHRFGVSLVGMGREVGCPRGHTHLPAPAGGIRRGRALDCSRAMKQLLS
jgi:hypothetical protein